MMKDIYYITLSLAGICQSAHLVQKLAYSGVCDQNAFNTCLTSILDINPTSVINIYGNNEMNLIIGLEILVSILTFSNLSYLNVELFMYIFKMIIIEKKLKKNYLAINTLKKHILLISNEYYLHNSIANLTNKIAKLYFKIISGLGSKILIKGLKIFLQNSQIQEKIRCLLFSGIRAIVLWRQFNGNQFQLIYFRNHIIRQANKILFNLKNNA